MDFNVTTVISPTSRAESSVDDCNGTGDSLNLQCIVHSLKDGQSSLVQLLLVTALSGVWLVYLMYFNSRFLGLVLSKILNQFSNDAYIHFGSISISPLTGKFMFRNVNYVTKDFSVRIQDGYCIFRWWRTYKFSHWKKQTDLNHGHTRLSIVMSGFEYHLYNRTSEYDRIQTLFHQNLTSEDKKVPVEKKTSEVIKDDIAWWRSLFPVIKFSIPYGKLVFGNKLLPNTLVIAFTDGEFQYMTTEPTTSSDIFLHILDGTLGFVRVVLMPNLRYDPSETPLMLGILDVHNEPPPRKMGEGYVVLNSNKVKITYSWDEPGLVKADSAPETPNAANDSEFPFMESQFADLVAPTDEGPIWEMVIRFGKHTNLNFGPWADRQRELLWKFFFPPDYQHLKVTKAPEVGERREAKNFKFSAMIMDRADIDILFTKNEAIHAIQINTAEGSCVEVDVPMTIGEGGYTSHVSGQLFHIEVSTSMQYKSLLKAEMFGFDIKSHFPTRWNGSQTWHCDITASKISASLLFAHKDFLSDLMADWSTKSAPDLMFFVPYTFKFNIKLDEMELFLPMNQYNWIDCKSELEDNAYLGLHAKELSVEFSTPFEDFLPSIYSIPFKFRLDQGQLCVFLPESSMVRSTLLNLAHQQQKWDQMPGFSSKSVNWGRTASKTWGLIRGDWVPCWEVPGVNLALTYTWHPIVETAVIKPINKMLLSSSKKRDNDQRPPSTSHQSSSYSEKHESTKTRARTTVTFDPTSLEADEIRIDLELTPGSVLVLYGSLLDLILIFKDNYLGYDDVYTDFNSKPHEQEDCSITVAQTLEVNSLEFRPLQVTVNINLEDINGILPIHPTSMYSSQPRVKLSQLHFEMDKNFLQTRLQLLLSGLEISVNDAPATSLDSSSNGCVQLSDLQFRGHAMFSGAGLPMGATLIEYAWLTEILVGAIKGKFTVTQIAALVEWMEVFVFLLSNEPNQLKKAFPHRKLPTGIAWDKVKKDGSCFEEPDVKYLMIKVRLESVHLRLAQNNSLLDLIVSPITISNGNVQDSGVLEAVSVVIEQVHLKHRMSKSNSDEWLETGEVRFGPFITQVAIATEEGAVGELQEEFLRFHDRKTRRLDFLWDRDFVDGHGKTSTGVASILESVRSMKSWGCAFFAPCSSKQHSTFYYENERPPERKRRLTSPPVSHHHIERDFTDGHDCSADSSEEVFDTRRDYGMSLLVDRKSLLSKPASPEKRAVKEQPTSAKPLSAGHLLMTAVIASPSPQGLSSPFKSMSEKSSSCEDLSRRKSRGVSTDSYLFRSTESEFQSASSISTDDYFSAESDVERAISKLVPAASDQTLDKSASPSFLPESLPLSRPEHLDIDRRPSVIRRLELNDGDDVELDPPVKADSPPSIITTKYPVVRNNELVECYSYVLSSSKLHNSEWMSDFDQVQEGIHPSVIIDKVESLQKLRKRPSMDILNESRSENCSRIVLHVKGGIDIQLTPYLVDFAQQVVDALFATVTTQHPLSVLNHVQMRCTSDAITDYHLSKLEHKEGDTSSQSDSAGDKPGTRVEIFIDSCRVNLVQATIGDDAVFNLNLNKMVPVPCITVATIRLDRLDLKSQLNSKRDKLLKKARMKNKSSLINSTEDSEETPNSMSTEIFEPSFVLFFCHASVNSLACQLRVLSHDGCAPERSNVTALPDDACRAPFKFNNKILLPAVKASMEQHADFQKRPPKPWGWVMAEAGIKKITSDLIKYDLQGPNPSKKHACEGNLNVEHLWLNLVTPQSPSQMSKFSRNYRSWNLVTSIAPSSSAWLAPCDRLIGAIDRLNAAVVRQHFVCMAAALTMGLKHVEDSDKTLIKPIQSKYDILTDLAKSIKADANCSLCDSLQRYLLQGDHLALLEAAIAQDRLVPPVGTLESGVQAVVSRWMQMAASKTKGEKADKKKMSNVGTMASVQENPTNGVTFNGNLDINTFLTTDKDKNTRRRQSTSGAHDVVDERASMVDEQRPTHSRAEDLVYEQQQSMYSWMQNQAQNDVEAQVGSKQSVEDSTVTKKDETNALLYDAKKAYANFLHNAKVTQSAEVGGNFLLSHCSGSLSVKAKLSGISVDKKEPDRIYSRDSARKRKKEPASLRRYKYASRQHSRAESPIILCENLNFDVSLIDTPVQEEKGKRTNEDLKNDSANNNRKKVHTHKHLKTRSKLNVDVGMSLEVVKQRIDIALVRLVHQFVQCSDSIQQAMTDLQVNKYTAGASSPDATSSHKRVISNISSITANSFYADQASAVRTSLRRRHTSPNPSHFTTHRDHVLDDVSIASSLSEESLAAAPCWRELYNLMNQQSSDSFSSYHENLRVETELKRGGSYLSHGAALHHPSVSMEITASLKLNELQLLAEVGDLKIYGKLCDLKADASHTRVSLGPFKHDAKSSMRAKLDQINVDVSEGGVTIKKTMLTSQVGLCRLEASTNHHRENEGSNTCSVFIGRIVIDLPQHPASIHDVVARGTKQLTSHIQEFAQTPSYKQSIDMTDGIYPPVTPSTTTLPLVTPMTPSAITAFIDLSQDSSELHALPVVVSLLLEAEGIEVGATLLPSLTVKYSAGKVTGDGVTGNDASFTIAMPKHSLHFSSAVSSSQNEFGPVSTDIELPPISGEGELKQHKAHEPADGSDLQMKEGEYLSISMKVGSFEHTLTTDLLNHLVFLQEVFMQEVNDVIQKMSSNEIPFPVWSDTSIKSSDSSADKPMLYQLQLLLDGIQITASTPSNNAVRLKTGTMTFELSNRVVRGGNKLKNIPKYLKLFGKAQVELNLALGTLVNNNVYPEVEPEFHQMAYFTTRVGLQNTTQQSHAANRMQGFSGVGKPSEDNSVILISLVRPIFSVQPTAFDKAILIFLAYKNAYDEWSEKREALEDDARYSTRQVVNAFQSRRAAMNNTIQPSTSTSKLFLQLSVHDLGICLPVSHHTSSYDASTQDELSSALVLTIDNTLISACYAKSLVTTGQFKGFCLRFADDFQTHWDDWSPKSYSANSFVVPDGTYQICTDTTSCQGPSSITARTTVNVVWQMKGVDVQLDTKIGSCIDRLVKTMTVIAGQGTGRESMSSDRFVVESETGSIVDESGDVVDGILKTSPSDPRMSSSNKELSLKEKSKKIEHEYNEQIHLVNDLRSLGAKQATIEEQERRLHELEVALSSVFRQTFKNRLRRSSIKTGSSVAQTPLKRPSHQRSVSSGMGMRSTHPLKSAYSAYSTLPPALSRPGGHDQAFFSDHTENSSNKQRFSSFETVSESSEGSSVGFDSDVVDGEPPVFSQDKIDDLLPDQDQFSQIALQPEADLELILDIRVGIDGGKIVCHLKEDEAGQTSSQSGMHRPLLTTKKPFDSNDTNTIFYVPGVEVKMRYNSEVGVDSKPQEFFTPPGSPKVAQKVPLIQVNTPGGTTKGTHNRSCVYVWFSLESLPETVISPYFLDFLEQTLNNLPISSSQSSHVTSHLEDQGAVEAFDSTIASLPDAVVFVSVQPSQVLFNCQPMSRVECLLHIPSLDVIFSSIRNPSDTAAAFHFPERKADGGASPDSLASAFPTGVGFTAVMSDFSVYVFHPYGSQATSGMEQKAGSGRKDSLSVDLEVVKINIVRTKKGAANMDASFRLQENATVINMSSLIDIGKASFKYDMRRLSEILAFPRAWYRRSIARRLFFGDVPEDRANTDEEKFPESPLSPRRSTTQVKSESGNKEEWFSTILYCLKMSRLDVQMNMSNVMGNTLWSCDGLRSQGKVQLQSSGDKNIFLSCGLENSQLSAKGGIIGGHIELRELYANCHLLEPVEAEPRHKVCVKMRSLDGRIEYMGGCIMMGKLTMVNLKLSDEWKESKLSTPASSEKSSVFVPGDVGWENFSLSISRSTTPDVIKMLAKLEEFFTQQFQSSVRALSSLRQQGRRESVMSRQSSVSQQEVYAFHRHWPSVYRAIRSLGDAPHFLLGGSLCLHGNQLTIVCFHGNNFRSRQWVLFNILEPNIMFSTEVQEIKESITGDEASTLAIQSLTFNLGHDYWLKTANASSTPMTTVSRVTRSRHENTPSSGASIDEWFAYVTASRNQELSMLRTLNDVSGQDSFTWSPAGSATRSGSSSSYNHDTDIIFALPKLQLDVRTEHLQGPSEPDVNSADKPVVECSFVTEFTDHICVTMDVELIMCLHDLISSYLKEKQQALSNKNRLNTVGTDHHSSVVDPIDIRQFECKTWQLEPTVRLISWAGRRIEPVGVDFILQKLGFRHARTTIPKWFQRGVLDVLDQTLALIVQNLVVTMMQQKKTKP